MASPRFIRPGATWFVTRRTTRRHFLLRPDPDATAPNSVQNIYWYVTAVVAQKHGIELHAVQVLSNHLHEVLTDPRGQLPAFLTERNRLLALALKLHRRWPGEFFDAGPPCCVQLYGPRAIAEKIAYTLANCIEAGLVRRLNEWPGVTTTAAELGTRVATASRPTLYFDPTNSQWPATASIAIRVPAEMRASDEDVRTRVESAVRTAVETARASARKANRVVPSRRALVTVPVTKRANRFEEVGVREPRFSGAGVVAEARRALADHRAFYAAYRAALGSLKEGVRNPFPDGAWRWPRELGAECGAPLAA